MKLKSVLPKLAVVLIVVFFLVRNFGEDRPLKDLNIEDISEVQIINFSSNKKVNLSNESDIKWVYKVISKIKVKKPTDKNVMASNLYYINLFLKNGEKYEIVDSAPYISLDGTWYEVNSSIFGDLKRMYNRYF